MAKVAHSSEVDETTSPFLDAMNALRLTADVIKKHLVLSVEEPAVVPMFNLKEVAMHDGPNDCWIIVYDHVFDITKFLDVS